MGEGWAARKEEDSIMGKYSNDTCRRVLLTIPYQCVGQKIICITAQSVFFLLRLLTRKCVLLNEYFTV